MTHSRHTLRLDRRSPTPIAAGRKRSLRGRVGANIRRRIGSRPRPRRGNIGAREALLLKRSFVLSPLMSSGVYSVDYRSARFSISPRQPEANVAFVRGPRRAPPLALRIQVTLDG